MSYLSRVTLDRGGEQATRLLMRLQSGSYAEHQLLWTLWGQRPDAARDFLFRRRDGADAAFYVLSRLQPESHGHGFIVESRPYQPALRAGDRLAFELRANPVVSRWSESGKQVRHDVVKDAMKRSAASAQRMEMERQAGIGWLRSRAEGAGFGFDDAEVRTGAYRQEVILRGDRDIRYSTLDFSGCLTVTDPERLGAVLHSGIGKARAFGCGLMLVRRT